MIHVDPLPQGGSTKFLKRKCNGELKELHNIIKVEFLGSIACLLNYKFCCSGEGILNWVYARFNEINFSNKIEGNMMLAIKIEEERKISFII